MKFPQISTEQPTIIASLAACLAARREWVALQYENILCGCPIIRTEPLWYDWYSSAPTTYNILHDKPMVKVDRLSAAGSMIDILASHHGLLTKAGNRIQRLATEETQTRLVNLTNQQFGETPSEIDVPPEGDYYWLKHMSGACFMIRPVDKTTLYHSPTQALEQEQKIAKWVQYAAEIQGADRFSRYIKTTPTTMFGAGQLGIEPRNEYYWYFTNNTNSVVVGGFTSLPSSGEPPMITFLEVSMITQEYNRSSYKQAISHTVPMRITLDLATWFKESKRIEYDIIKNGAIRK